ncbi:hypothetical protein MCHLDSM_03849 [Mycolicibacterium chlorophenolicum]|uniref:Uncharacterized protein n=1 Tax=Mycolicibacterium chlorophenolicum TaxID=37916 RepID=A0A0J6VRP4_9MYCO|nr:hypothetical protein MCHLDSM_03849 [Mycolicibacterium chlorophenolicum]
MAVVYADAKAAPLVWCSNGAMKMPMPMENCPMYSAMDEPCPRCQDRM